MKKYITLFFLLSLTLHSEEEGSKVSIGLDVVFWGDWPRLPVEVATSSGTKVLGLIPYDNSQFFVYNGPAKAVFSRRSKNVDEHVKAPVAPLFTAELPMGVKRALLIVFVPGNQDTNYKAMVISCDEDGFPPNSVMVWNSMPTQLLARFGSVTATLDAAKPSVFKVVPSDDTLQVMLAGMFRGKQQLLYSSSIRFSAGLRSLVILYNSNPAEEGRIDVFNYELPSTADRQTIAAGGETKNGADVKKLPEWKESLPYKIDYQPPPRPELSIR